MKKIFFLFLLTVFLLLLVSCTNAESSDEENTVTYTVTFDSGEGSAVLSQNIKSVRTVDSPANPVQSGYVLAAWYNDAGFQTVYDFGQPVEGDMTLYARWQHELKSVIESRAVPVNLSDYGFLVRAVLAP